MAVVYQFHAEQWLPYPVPLVFSFFANPANLPRLQPRWQKMRIEQATFAPPPPPPPDRPHFPGIVAGAGSRLLLSVRPFPFSPLRTPWEALIEDFEWDHGFCDVQVRGPFRSWRHCHTVAAAPSPESGMVGTAVRDEVRYELPLGRLNPLADKLAAKNALAYTFRVRHKQTEALLKRMTGRGA
jgi:ligand-binding SRPBCC domain-containing protein